MLVPGLQVWAGVRGRCRCGRVGVMGGLGGGGVVVIVVVGCGGFGSDVYCLWERDVHVVTAEHGV